MALVPTSPLERFYAGNRFSDDDPGSFDRLVEHWRRAFDTTFDPELEFHEPGLPGTPERVYTGVDEILDGVVRGLPDQVSELWIEPTEFLAADDAVVVLGFFRGTTKAGNDLRVRFANIWRFCDGRAVRHDAYPDTAAFFGAMGFLPEPG